MASRGINKVILIGNLVADPELRYTQNSTAIANLSIATSETWKDKQTGEQKEQTEWHRCVAYRRLAEIAGEYLKKGSKVYVEGRLQTRKWEGQDGVERYTTEIVINDLQMLDGASGRDQSGQHAPAAGYGSQRAPAAASQTPIAPARSGLGTPMPGRQAAPAKQPEPFVPDQDFDDDVPFAPFGKQYRSLLNCI